MKKLLFISLIFIGLSLTSCIVVDSCPGPNGRDGYAYFGVDYDRFPIYSYWDNNNSIPHNPIIGQYYLSGPGTFQFEYFINEHEYWYGTYQIWINRGGPGRPDGIPGFDGADTYLFLVCNPNGFYEYRENHQRKELDIKTAEGSFGNYKIVVNAQKTTIEERPAHSPKYIQNKPSTITMK
ncbi:MAG: hypothetical protein IT232_02800 [Flavobacteriales bacterium]|nr:hypothetical protein [Flavobacteriales bacterium]